MISRLSLLIIIFAAIANADDSKTCATTDFCKRLRNEDGHELKALTTKLTFSSVFLTVPLTAKSEFSGLSGELLLEVHRISDDITRVFIGEDVKKSARPVLFGVWDGKARNVSLISGFTFQDDVITISHDDGDVSTRIYPSPFKIELLKGSNVMAVLNARNKITYELDGDNMAVGFDISIPKAKRAYGLGFRPGGVALKNTMGSNSDPYRLFNLNQDQYDVNSNAPLSGNVPFVFAHGLEQSAGVMFHNGYEQWVDVGYDDDDVQLHFMAENGDIDVFFFAGPTPQDVLRQYAALTGTAPLPPLWSLGYHQSRMSYQSADEVKDVVANFDLNNFPVDAVWLDIEHTDEYKYFTWNPTTFADPLELQNNVSSTHRKLVAVVNPHLKVDKNYFAYNDIHKINYLVKAASGSDYLGTAWPEGDSAWIDFANEEARDTYATFFSFDNFAHTTPTLAGIWNSLNEPTVFNEVERVLPPDSYHRIGEKKVKVPHSAIHNLYSLLMTQAIYEGLLQRNNNKTRPFVMTQSFFAGSQRYAAVNTGHNSADWGHLAASFVMCMEASLAGISFCGADVGGFNGNPDEQLLQRWYQAAAWLPLFRSHSSGESARREPYLLGVGVQENVRASLRLRYAHLPVWYTLFYEHERFGDPVVRPLFYHYRDSATFEIGNQILVGPNILVSAVTQPDVTSLTVYLPVGELWYDVDTPLMYTENGQTKISLTMDRIPVLYRGGSIIYRKDTPQRNSVDMTGDSYTGYVFLDQNNYANGTLYIDDYESFDYRNKAYSYIMAEYVNGAVVIKAIDADASYSGEKFVVESYKVFKRPSTFKSLDDFTVPEVTVYNEDVNGIPLSKIQVHTNSDYAVKLL